MLFNILILVWHDVPFGNSNIAKQLSKKMHGTDMLQRFDRVECFLDYLNEEENKELSSTVLPIGESQLLGPFVPEIKQSYLEEKKLIRSKLGL